LQKVFVRVSRFLGHAQTLDELESFRRNSLPQRARKGHVAALCRLFKALASSTLPRAVTCDQSVDQVSNAADIIHDVIQIKNGLNRRDQHLLLHLAQRQLLLFFLLFFQVKSELVEEVRLKAAHFYADLPLLLVIGCHVDAAFIERPVSNAELRRVLECLQDLSGNLGDDFLGEVQLLIANETIQTWRVTVVGDGGQSVTLDYHVFNAGDVWVFHELEVE